MNDSTNYTLRVKAGQAGKIYWKDIWRFRELFYFLAWRDILVRYKQTKGLYKKELIGGFILDTGCSNLELKHLAYIYKFREASANPPTGL